MQHSFIIFLPILLLILLHDGIITVANLSEPKNYCSSTKHWSCNLTEALEAPDWFIQPSYSAINEESPREYLRSDIDDLSMHSAYQTPVDEQTGKLYVALRLDWRLNNDFIQSKNVTFWLRINQFDHDEAVSTIFMKIYGYRNEEISKKGRISFHTDFQLFIDKKLQIGRLYDLTLVYRTDDGSKSLISSKTLNIPMIHLDAEDNRPVQCDSEHIEKSRKIAARWVPAIYTAERHIARVVVITFFAAPKWFCFDSYEVKLFQNNLLLKTVTVTNDDLYRNGSNWMANVTFAELTPNMSHIVTIKPFEYRGKDESICLCRISSSCDCVLARSKPFSLEDTGKNIYGKVLEEKFLAKQRTKVSEKETETKEMKPLIIVFLIFTIIAAILIIAFLGLCLYRTLKNTSKWQKTLLLKTSGGSGESLTPLIKTPPIQRIFILNPNSDKTDFVTELAQFLQSKGLTVFYFGFDSKQLEENAFYYVHKAIADSDKIILFHGKETQKFIENGKFIRETITSNYYDNAFIIALSLLKLNDSKILHSNFDDDNSINSSKSLITETLYTLPRDLGYLFQGLRLPVDQTAVTHLNDMYFAEKDSESSDLLESIISHSPESVRKIVEEESVVVPQGNDVIIEVNKNEKCDAAESSNTDSGFHSS